MKTNSVLEIVALTTQEILLIVDKTFKGLLKIEISCGLNYS